MKIEIFEDNTGKILKCDEIKDIIMIDCETIRYVVSVLRKG